jgi:DNA-directed RNA polymerase sigma subunit (sigma70/sigma32)
MTQWNEGVFRLARREYAWQLRTQGATYEEIARRLAVTRERARQIVFKEFQMHYRRLSRPLPERLRPYFQASYFWS